MHLPNGLAGFFWIVSIFLFPPSPWNEGQNSPRLTLNPCTVGKTPARCGDYEVFENRATKTGRKIKLKIVVFPATGTDRAPDPFVYIPGGPGSSATEDAPYVAQDLGRIRKKRDLLFVDQRGTGGSNPLDCQLFNPADLQSYLGYFFPLDDVKKCREQLEKKADLTLYTTAIAVDDLEEVREALGYGKLNLMGASYGTRAAMVYLRQHPQSVRTVTLFGVSPTSHHMPRTFAQDTERALQGVIGECAADEACNRAFPNLRAEAKAVLERLLKGPVEVSVRQAVRGEAQANDVTKVNLSRDLAAEAIRYMLYNPGAVPRIPLFLYQAAQGDFVPLAQAALNYRRQIVSSGSNGMYLSVTCAEDLPWVKAEEVERLSANTFLGDYRSKQQLAACELWPRSTIPAEYASPVQSAVPVLIFTGQWDPVTPPSNGDFVARSLSNNLHLVVPQGGHGLGGMQGGECVDRLHAEFVEQGSVKGLDVTCVKAIRRQPWVLTGK